MKQETRSAAMVSYLLFLVNRYFQTISTSVFNPENRELAVIPVQSNSFGTNGGEALQRVSEAWSLKFYFKE